MTKRKLKGYVKPTLFMISVSIITISLMILAKDVKTSNGVDNTYVMNALIDTVTPVVNTNEEKSIKPYTSDKVSLNKSYYEKDATPEEQQNALIYYEDTYLQNSGIIYSSSEEFDVGSVLDLSLIHI